MSLILYNISEQSSKQAALSLFVQRFLKELMTLLLLSAIDPG
jgi:hypothetical protein